MKVLSLVFMILGCFLGAGFVSGREIASYFSRFGNYSWLGIIFAGLIFFGCLFLFLQLSNKANNFTHFISIYFGKFGLIITILFSLCLFILISSMMAGTISISNALNINYIAMSIITMIICFVCVSGHGKMLSKINFLLMPIILIILLEVCGINFNIEGQDSSLFGAFISSSNYVLINIVSLGVFVIEIGSKYTVRQKLLSSIIVTLIIVFFMFVINNAILKNNLVYVSMPILELAKFQSKELSLITAIILWCGLFTTIISCVYVLSNFMNRIIGNYRLTVAIVLILSFLCGFIGFEFIVGYIYSVIGVIGLVFMVFIIKQEKETFIVKVSRKK